jgi:nucleotide-binding universal stress UspA family protein
MVPKSIIVPLDGSAFAERAIPVARALCDQFGAELTLVTARWDDVPDRAQAYLDEVAGAHAADHVMYIADRGAADAIQLLADEGDDQLICMTSHGRGRLRWSMLGSVAEDVIRRSRHPIVVVGRHCELEWPNGFSHALVCLDGSNAADPISGVAEEWAQQLGLQVHMAQVVHPLDVEGIAVPNAAIAETLAHLRAQGVVADAQVISSSWFPGALADCAARFPGALIMMSSRGRTGMSRLALGSVSMGVVSLSASPVVLTHSA